MKNKSSLPLRKRLTNWLIRSALMLIVATLILVLRRDYSPRGFSDAFFIPGIVLFFVFLLKLVKDAGTFDMIAYTATRIIHGIRKKEVASLKDANTYIEYKRLERQTQSKYYWPDIVLSTLFIGAGAILAFI